MRRKIPFVITLDCLNIGIYNAVKRNTSLFTSMDIVLHSSVSGDHHQSLNIKKFKTQAICTLVGRHLIDLPHI